MFNEIFKNRELYYQSTFEEDVDGAVYCGFDGTAKSLQIGNLLALSALRLASKSGKKIIALIGGATTEIGDPSGKNETRKVLERTQIESNFENITKQIKKLIPEAEIVNNKDWISKLSFMDFLEKAAKYIPVGALIKLETFAKRLENNDPFNTQELLYPLVQGYDFLHLFEEKNCTMQLGGSDQWSNILTGADLIKRKHGSKKAKGLTFELLTNSQGVKLGKSVNGAIWIDPNECSIFDFWQYWRNISDDLLIPCLKKLTLVEIDELERFLENPNEGKILLANEITSWVHSHEDAKAAEKKAKSIFLENNLNEAIEIKAESDSILEFLVSTKTAKSNSEAKKLIEQGSIKVNQKTIEDKQYKIKANDIVQIGKKKFFKVNF